MSNVIRAFIAVKIPSTSPLRKVVTQLAGMGRAVRAVDADKLHVTLKFLGDTPAESAAEIGRVVQRVAETKPAFDLRMVGLGAFPHAGRPSVVWAGLEEADTLIRVADELDQELKRLGFPRERRKFRPHLTLARVRAKPPAELGELLQLHASTEFGIAPVASVELLQSELRPEGSLYTVLASGELAGE